MVYFDLSFRSMFTKDIVEDEEELWTEKVFHVFPLIEVLIMARGYSLSMVPFVLALVYRRGGGGAYFWAGSWSVLCIWLLFSFFLQTKLKSPKTGLHADLYFNID